MAKSYLKLLGMELLYLLMTMIVAGIAGMLQYAGKVKTGINAGMIFAGSTYDYNLIAYIAGALIFAAFLVLSCKYLVLKQAPQISEYTGVQKVLLVIVAVVFAFLMFVMLFFESLVALGLAGFIDPEPLLYVTGFGWPFITIVYITVIVILYWKPRKIKDRED